MGQKGESLREEFYFYTQAWAVGYHKTPLVKDIRLRLKKGEILTLIGPNGAGKTTVLKSVARQLEPLGGMAFLDGKRLEQWSNKELSTRTAIVLTARVRPELMTCQEVVATGRYPYTGRFGRLSGKDKEIVEEAMELVHITGLAHEDFQKISDGQSQRVMLARAISQEPDLLVLDEPTSFLDIRYKLEFLSVLQGLARKRKLSILLSLHELELAGCISDKVACVKGGRIDRYGTPEEVFTPGYIEGLYQMAPGRYDWQTGGVELLPPKGAPKVFVLAGNGSGTPVYRRLQREGIPFATGILWENDLDYPVAKKLAAEVVEEKAFCRIGREKVDRARKLIKDCGEVVCTLGLEQAGELYPGLEEWLKMAELKAPSCRILGRH